MFNICASIRSSPELRKATSASRKLEPSVLVSIRTASITSSISIRIHILIIIIFFFFLAVVVVVLLLLLLVLLLLVVVVVVLVFVLGARGARLAQVWSALRSSD